MSVTRVCLSPDRTLIWGHQAKRLNLVQKRAVRILTASKYNSHTEPVFKQTNILKVSDICTLNDINYIAN